MGTLRKYKITDIRTGRVDTMKGKSRRTIEKRLGKRADDVLIHIMKDIRHG